MSAAVASFRLPRVIVALISAYLNESITVRIYPIGTRAQGQYSYSMEVDIAEPVFKWREKIYWSAGHPSPLYYLYHRQQLFRLDEELTPIEQPGALIRHGDKIEILEHPQHEQTVRAACESTLHH